MANRFIVSAPYGPSGDQIPAVEKLVEGYESGERFFTLKGVTGSGKTYTMAKLIERVQKPTLVVCHNKTLAAQLYREFKDFFPDNAVEYFVSYYDYYQPEAYIPSRDLYIEKDSSINEEIERMRLSATASLIDREDVIIVATVSCIYGLGNPESFKSMQIPFVVGEKIDLGKVKAQLVNLHYERNDNVLERSRFRIKGDVLDIYPAYSKNILRIEMDWDTITRIRKLDPISAAVLDEPQKTTLFPARHFVMPQEQLQASIGNIRLELEERYQELLAKDRVVEAARLKSRTEYDIEMMTEMGFCPGIENYSRQLTGRKTGVRPQVLLDYFPENYMTIIDECHVTVSQLGAMYEGDRSRKQTLIDFGFRLPSALDNRPLKLEEIFSLIGQTLFVSATPGPRETGMSSGVIELINRPTGLLDPPIEVRSTEGQMEDVFKEAGICISRGERILITTLTKKMSEDLTDYLNNLGMKVRYLHSDIETIERVEILRDLRLGKFDILVGINLLREGLDLPEVSLVIILDADKIGFLRSATALIQTIGRAARNVNGRVIMYADKESAAMAEAIRETNRRREIQHVYNQEHGITPTGIIKAVHDILTRQAEKPDPDALAADTVEAVKQKHNLLVADGRKEYMKELEQLMFDFAKNLEFEQAALVRDEIDSIRKKP